MISMAKYRTWIFDCDGVILDSNPIKSEAFYELALPYGQAQANSFLAFHRTHGGVSRFKKWEHFFRNILQEREWETLSQRAVENYGTLVKTKLLACRETEGLRPFLQDLDGDSRKIVVSGGLQKELREVFQVRGLHLLFDAVFGSPHSKEQIIEREELAGIILRPAVFIGDSRYDFECSSRFGLDFIFLSRYTEFDAWSDYFVGRQVTVARDFTDLKCRVRD